MWSKFWGFWSGVLSDNGSPSSSRVAMLLICLTACLSIGWIFWNLPRMEVAKLQVWLPSLPLILAALAGVIVSPYGVNQVSAVVDAFRKKPEQQPTEGPNA
jgi:hypothetical protein